MPTYRLLTSAILSQKSDCLLLFSAAAGGSAKLSPAARAADKMLDGQISMLCRSGDFKGEGGAIVWLPAAGGHKRVLLAGLGADDEDARDGLTAAFTACVKREVKDVAAAVEHLSPELAAQAVQAAQAADYTYRQGGYLPKAGKLRRVLLAKPPQFNNKALAQAAATAAGISLTRHLAEQPGNICTPVFLGQCAQALAKKTTLRVGVLNEKQIQKQKMGALLAVAQGSAVPPRFIVMEHRGGGKTAPVVLVGKGVTFDTGGISLKPAAAMDEMKFDMCGAATVFGVLLAAAQANLPVNVTGIIPTCENMPGGRAIKPGDVITAASGKTIEILNTDAEGRLILADALHYADQLKPAAVIDIATLTGACVIALGHHVSGLMGRGDSLLAALTAAGEQAGDHCWQLPLGKKYQQQLKTDYADVANIGGRSAGTITAACFLSRFVECKQWAHLDIAGTAWTTAKRATGRPVPLLVRYLASLGKR